MFSGSPNPLILKAFQASLSRVYVLNMLLLLLLLCIQDEGLPSYL